MSNDCIERAANEFAGVKLEKRLRARVARTVAAIVSAPDKTFPDMMPDDAALDGCYRLLSNGRVEADVLAAPHRARTCERIAECDDVIVAHDTSTIAFSGDGERDGMGPLGGTSKRGFFLHASIAIERSTLRPVGVLHSMTWSRGDVSKSGGAKRRGAETIANPTRESLRWENCVAACAKSAGAAAGRLLHVMDSEGDSFARFAELRKQGHRFLIRLAHDRCVVDADSDRIRALLEKQEARFALEVPLSPRKGQRVDAHKKRKAPRTARTAALQVVATAVRLRAPSYLREELGDELTLNVVRAYEPAPPSGEQAVDWILYTTEPIDTDEHLRGLLRAYRARWIVEDLFKALKTGCQIEKRQLESYHAMTNALALFIPVAWQMLLLRNVARTEPEAPATSVLTQVQIDVINALGSKKLPPGASARDALLVVAKLGGHLAHNGEPGWQTLGRGFERLLAWEEGWRARDLGNP